MEAQRRKREKYLVEIEGESGEFCYTPEQALGLRKELREVAYGKRVTVSRVQLISWREVSRLSAGPVGRRRA